MTLIKPSPLAVALLVLGLTGIAGAWVAVIVLIVLIGLFGGVAWWGTQCPGGLPEAARSLECLVLAVRGGSGSAQAVATGTTSASKRTLGGAATEQDAQIESNSEDPAASEQKDESAVD